MPDQLVDRIMDRARSRLPGAVDNQIYLELASVLDDFFKWSTCWRERIQVPVTADSLVYELDSTDFPARILSLVGFVDSNEAPYGATIPNSNLLTLTRLTAAGDYYAYVILTVSGRLPGEDYPRFPQWVSDIYGDCIVDGLAGAMMSQPAKPWSSPNHAVMYSRKFKQGALQARIEANRQNLYGGQNWRFPRFAAQNKVR